MTIPIQTRGDVRLNRSVTATWWYTAAAIVFFEVMLVLITVSVIHLEGHRPAVVLAVGVGSLLWVLATVAALRTYRHRTDGAPILPWRPLLAPLAVAIAYGVVAGLLTGIWVVAVVPIAQLTIMLNWPPGVRMRVTMAATLLLTILAFVDVNHAFAESSNATSNWTFLVAYSVVLPAASVLSLWWWDVLVRLDRARAAEARLGATQERLRVATDVHDLQGHHLQVVALQLELADRLIDKGRPKAALEQVRAARASVADAQQGTRDLATRFRGVSLEHEIANAVDLLRAAGTAAEATVGGWAERAPSSVLGPVIRETTTNVLRHGGGRWARLSLTADVDGWRYEVANDTAPDTGSDTGSDTGAGADGAGLDGIARRVAEAGGAVAVQRGRNEFSVTVTVPETVLTSVPATTAREAR